MRRFAVWALVALCWSGTAVAGETVQLGHRGLQVGEAVVQTSKMAMQLELDVVANGSLSVPQSLIFYEMQAKTLEALAVDGAELSEVRVRFARRESSQGTDTMGKVEISPLAGQSYLLTRRGSTVVVERDGSEGSPEELALAGVEFATATGVGRLALSLPSTLEVGVPTEMTTAADGSLFGGSGKLTSGTVTLERVAQGEGERRAHLVVALTVRTEPIPGMKGHMALGGTLELGVDSGRAYSMKLRGEMKVSGASIDGAQTVRVRGSGPVMVERTSRFE